MRLQRDFYTRDGITVAKELLGKILVHETSVGTIKGIITETESYMGIEDKGSHTYGGKRTNRTEPMFHIGGTSYVYLIYGMYNCVNITTYIEDVPQAVLIRKVEPADELSRERMIQLRSMTKRKKQTVASIEKHLADGPGKLCIAMEITRAHNDIDMVTSEELFVTHGKEMDASQIKAGKRIGIDYAEEAADYLWRFYL